MTAFAVPSDNIGPRPSEQPQAPPSPTLMETFGAAFGLYNPSVAMWQHGRDQNARGSFAPVEGYNAWDDIKDKPEYLPHATFFAGSRSPSETQVLKDRIDQQKEDERIYAASGPIGTVAGFMAGTLDPTLLLPGKIAISALKEGRPFIRSALETSAGAVSQTATQDMILRAAQPDKPVAETVLSVASATILGAVLGPAARWLSPSEREALTRGLDHERALNDAHVSGRPAGEQATASLREQARAAKGDVPEMERIQRQEVAQALPQTQVTSRGFKLPLAGDKGAIEFDVDHDLVTITGAHLAEEERGKGIAFQGYKGIVDWALSTGRPVRSIGAPSADAARIYEGLGKAGYSVERAPDEVGRISYQIKPPEAAQEAPAIAMAAGAAAADVRTIAGLSIQPTGVGIEKLAFGNKALKGMQVASVIARRAFADLSELGGMRLTGNVARKVDMRAGEEIARGEPPRYETQFGQISTSGPPPLETQARLAVNQTVARTRAELEKQWTDLAFEPEKTPRYAVERSQLGLFGFLPDTGKPTFEQFKTLVGEAIQNDNKHEIPQVQAAAEKISKDVFDTWGERAETAVEGFKRAEQAEGEGYFPHLWNKVKIAAYRPEFTSKLTGWYSASQDAKRAAQGRLRAYQNSLDVNEEQIAKLTRRMEKKQADLEEDEALREEVSKINKFAYRRAEALREGEFINVGGVAVPVPGKNIQKARGGAPFETVARARVNELADRASGVANEIAEIDEKLLAAHFKSVEMRAKIEDELGKWQGKSVAEAKSALKARTKYEAERDARREAEGKPKLGRVASADEAVDTAVKRILGNDYDRPAEDLWDRASQTVDRILGSPDGRLPYDEAATKNFGVNIRPAPYRGSLAERLLDVPNSFARDWIENDIERVMNQHLHTFVPDVLLAERFGDSEMSNVFRQVEEEYSRLIAATGPDTKERLALNKERDSALANLAATRDTLRGTIGIQTTPLMKNVGRVSANVRNAMVFMNMGMAMMSSLGDAAGAIARYGMMHTFGDAWLPYFKSLATDQKYSKEAARQFRNMGISLDVVNASRHHALSNVAEDFVPQSPFERTLQWAADKTQIVSGLAKWTDINKMMVANIAAAEIYRAGKAVDRGAATAKQLTQLAESNITPDMAMRIARHYEESGNRVDGILLPNTEEWKGPGSAEAKLAFEAALSREAEIAVATPGIERAVWTSDPVLAAITQFKGYTGAAHTRILIANLQRADAQTLQGFVAMIGLGMLSYKAKSVAGGQPTSDRPQDWIKEAMSASNMLGWFEEFNAMSAKMTRGRADIYRLIGADKPLSRFANVNAAEQVLGPTFGKLEALAKVTGAAASGEWSAADTHALRRFGIWQNLPYTRGLFNEVETGINNAFGIPQQAPRRQ